MLIKELNNYNEYLITMDIDQLAHNANVTPELLKALLKIPRENPGSCSVFGCMYNVDQLPPGCPAPRPPVHALTHQVLGVPRLDVSGNICQIKIQVMPRSDVVHDAAHTLIPMLGAVLNNETYDFGGTTAPHDGVVALRECTTLVPRIVNTRATEQSGNYSYSMRNTRYPVTVDVENEGIVGDWEIHGWDFVYDTPNSVIDGGSVISDPATGPLNLYLDHDDPDPAGTIATMINTYFASSTNMAESKYVKIREYLDELDKMLVDVSEHLTQQSPELSPTNIANLLVTVRAHALFQWLKERNINL